MAKKYTVRAKEINHLGVLINNKNTIHCLYTLDKNFLMKVSQDLCDNLSIGLNKTIKPNIMFRKIVCILDYFRRFNPQNKWLFLSKKEWRVLLDNFYYRKILNELANHNIFEVKRIDKRTKSIVHSGKKTYLVDAYYYVYRFTDYAVENLFQYRPIKYFQNKKVQGSTNKKLVEHLTDYLMDITNPVKNYEDESSKIITKQLRFWEPAEDTELYIRRHNKSLASTKLDISEKEIENIQVEKAKEGKNVNVAKLVENFNNVKCLKTMDKQLRVYSPLTSLPREVRKHLNYSWSVDIHNSQPLLLSMLLREYYTHDHSIQRFIDTFFENKSCLYYWNIERGANDYRLPEDVKQYIDLVGESKLSEKEDFWSKLTDKMIELKGEQLKDKTLTNKKAQNIERYWLSLNYQDVRDKVKKNSFKDVFYSHKNYDSEIKDLFKIYFPNVLEAILNMRWEIEQYCWKHNKAAAGFEPRKDGLGLKRVVRYEECLSTLLMKIESVFIIQSMIDLYKSVPNGNFVTVHDAIYCIIDDKQDKVPTPIKAKKILRKIYRAFGLKPKFGEERKKVLKKRGRKRKNKKAA